MVCWYYDKRELRHTPSIKAGLTLEQETLYRREGARFILQVGNKMGLRYETMATGVVFFHRFYMVHTFLEFPRHVTACCCLFLAGKVEETPKKCRDIMKTAKMLMKEDTWAEFGADPREEVMTLERIILQTIKFDFIVEHPYAYLLKYAKCLKGDKKKMQNMVQMAWTFVNDSLCTTLCLQWEAEIIAIALMYLAGKLSKFEVTDWAGRNSRHSKWWDVYTQGITTELLEDICHQVLDLYAPNKAEAAGGDAKRVSTATAGATRAPTHPPSGGAASTTPQKQPPEQQQQAQAAPTAVQEQCTANNPPAAVTLPVPVITTTGVGGTPSKDDTDSGVGTVEAITTIQSVGSSAPPATPYTPYNSYQYPGYNPAYPPPPSAPPRYNYSSYQAPPTQTPPSTAHAPPPPPTHYQPSLSQAAPSTPHAPPPPTPHYPPPITPNTQAPPPSHYTPYSSTPTPPPPYRTAAAPSAYTGPPPPHTPQPPVHPSPRYPTRNVPTPPYYGAGANASSYGTPQGQYPGRQYYGSGS